MTTENSMEIRVRLANIPVYEWHEKLILLEYRKVKFTIFFIFFQNSSFVWSRKGYSRNEYVVLLFKTIFLGNNQINLIWNALGIEGVIENAKIELIFRHASDLELIFPPYGWTLPNLVWELWFQFCIIEL